jgi:predicted methyltransferase
MQQAEVMRLNMFIAQHTENIRALNLAAVKLKTVQMTKLLLQHTIIKIRHDLLCKACPDRGLVHSAQGRIFKNMLYVRYIYLPKAKPTVTKETRS